MIKEMKYICEDFEKEILEITEDAIQCCITSAFFSEYGVNFLEKISQKLSKIINDSGGTKIKLLLSNRFAADDRAKIEIINKLEQLPNVEIRVHDDEVFLHRKNLIFYTEKEIRVIIGSTNITWSGLNKNHEFATFAKHDINDSEAAKVIEQFDNFWVRSTLVHQYKNTLNQNTMEPRYKIGDTVLYNKQIAIVRNVIINPNNIAYQIFLNNENRTIREEHLTIYIDENENLLDKLDSGDYGDFNDFVIFNTWFRLSRPIENNIYSYLSSRTIFNPHQFKPLLRFISSNSDERLFIADEVGVGKTIEAGIIISELIARQKITDKTPVLIVCPNSLGHKWEKEMKEKFRLPFKFLNSSQVKDMLYSTLNDNILPIQYHYSIVSLQLLRGNEPFDLLEQIYEKRDFSTFGLIIIDEAHHLRNTETISNALGHRLSTLTDMLLMLSATPLNLHNNDLFHLMNILNPDIFPDFNTFELLHEPVKILNTLRNFIISKSNENFENILVLLNQLENDNWGKVFLEHPGVKLFSERLRTNKFFLPEEIAKFDKLFVSLSPLFYSFTRTRKREAFEIQVIREARYVPVKLSSEERTFYDNFLQTVEEMYLEEGQDPRNLRFITNIHRRMLSSCIPALADYIQWCVDNNKLLSDKNFEDETEDDSEFSEESLGTSIKQKFQIVLNQLEEIKGKDSKFDTLNIFASQLLKKSETPQMIIFSFFIRTLEYLYERLTLEGFTVGIIHGKIPSYSDDGNSRENVMEDFKNGKYQILLSSEVGGEGLDFQFCNVLINYDLPYNPMRVEQRIGRIDRFGQKSEKIIIASIIIEDTVDAEIYIRLYQRIQLVEQGVGALEPILGNALADIQNEILSGSLSPVQLEEKTKRMEISIKQAIIQSEEFEKNRSELLGDDYLAIPIEKNTNTNFIKPADIATLTENYLKLKSCDFKENDEFSYTFKLNSETRELINSYARLAENQAGYNELKPLFTETKAIDVVFDGSKCEDYKKHIFLAPTGFWARFIIKQLREENKIKSCFSFETTDNLIIPNGHYIILFYEIRFVGFKTEIDFLGIPVATNNGNVVVCNYSELTRQLGKSIGTKTIFQEILDINAFKDNAEIVLSKYCETQEEELLGENQYRIESKINAIKKSCESRITSRKLQIENHKIKYQSQGKNPDEKYIILQNRLIKKETERSNALVAKLEEKKKLTIDYKLVALTYLKSM